jgi:hypothetical protein
MELYFRSPNTPSWRGNQLKAQGQLYLLPLPLFKYTLHMQCSGHHLGAIDAYEGVVPTSSCGPLSA